MPDRVFLDTNILVYAFDVSDDRRHALAVDLLEEHLRNRTAVLSLQVLQEFFVTVTRKISRPLEPRKARNLVAEFLRHDVVEPSSIHLLMAMDFTVAHKIALWDALVVAVAAETSCKTLYTEDLRHDAVLSGVRVVNPFKA
jgi:predicted nucleic acid-binding protein